MVRGTVRSSLAWVFGISLSILFVSLWGRAVVIDTDTLGESIAPLAGSTMVVDVVSDWLTDELVESGADPAMVDPAVDYFVHSPAMGSALDVFAAEIVSAASSSEPSGSSVDMRDMLLPAVPDVTAGLSSLGYQISESEIEDVVAGLDPLVIRDPESSALVGPASPTASRLGTASLLAALALVATGWWYVALSPDRLAALRSLLNRVAVGGLSFALFLRLGSWAVDPGGGRAPLAETMSNVAASKWHVPMQTAVVAAILGLAAFLARRHLKREAASRSAVGRPTPREEQLSSRSRPR